MKRVLLIGATGMLGSHIQFALEGSVTLIASSLNSQEYPVDLSDTSSLKRLLERVGSVDAIICTGGVARFKGWYESSDEDWNFSLQNKLMGQINLIRYGERNVTQGGSITLTTGVLAQYSMPGSAMVSSVNAALEAAIRTAALECNQGVRVNAVSPGWVKETLLSLGKDPTPGIPASEVAQIFIQQMEQGAHGSIALAKKQS